MVLKSREFRREREGGWRELEALVERIERKGHSSLTTEELSRLPSLYRAALSSLAVARAVSLDQNLLLYLEGLSTRAYLCVYAKRSLFWPSVQSFFARRLSALVYQQRRLLLFSIGLLALGVIVGYAMVRSSPELFYSFVSPEMAQGRSPTSSQEELLSVLQHTESKASTLSTFASFLFTHNAKIGLLCFSLGVLLGAPVLLLLFSNGLTLGAFGAIYASRGLGLSFWAWVLPHGVTELLAVSLSGVAGFMLAHAALFPGAYRRIDNLMLRGREAALVMLGAVALFFVAALFEGFFRQLVTSVPIRYAVALCAFLFWSWYFSRAKVTP